MGGRAGPTLSGNFQSCWGMLPTETAGEQYIAINSTLYTLILKLLTMWVFSVVSCNLSINPVVDPIIDNYE